MSAGLCSEATPEDSLDWYAERGNPLPQTVGPTRPLAHKNPNQIHESVSTLAGESGPVTFGTQVLRWWWLFRPS